MCKEKAVKGAWNKHSAYVVRGMQTYSIDVGREEDWQSYAVCFKFGAAEAVLGHILFCIWPQHWHRL